MKPQISIVVPVYKVPIDLLQRCIESCSTQENKSIEVILVDDCSPDSCGEVCDEFAAKFNNVKVIHKNVNEGLSAARNTGVLAANGEWITFVDGDDWIESDTCNLVNREHDKDIEMIFFGSVREYENGTDLFQMPYPDGKVFDGSECKQLQKDVLNYNKRIATAYGKFVRRDFLKNNNLLHDPEVRCGIEGIEYNLRVFGYLKKAIYYEAYKYHYVYNTQSITGMPNERNNEYLLLGLNRMHEYIYANPQRLFLQEQFEARVQRVISDLCLSCYFNPYYKISYRERKDKLKAFLNVPVIKKVYTNTHCYEKSMAKRVIYYSTVHRLYLLLVVLGKLRMRVLEAK